MIRGKAILYIEREGTRWDKRPRLIVDPKVSTATDTRRGSEHAYYVAEDLEYSPPDCARKLRDGERIWVSVVFEVDYHGWTDYYSGGYEVDAEVYYEKVRILKRRPPRKPVYIRKGQRDLPFYS